MAAISIITEIPALGDVDPDDANPSDANQMSRAASMPIRKVYRVEYIFPRHESFGAGNSDSVGPVQDIGPANQQQDRQHTLLLPPRRVLGERHWQPDLKSFLQSTDFHRARIRFGGIFAKPRPGRKFSTPD
jgi:hypothetical protein